MTETTDETPAAAEDRFEASVTDRAAAPDWPAELGTVIANFPAGERPAGFEGDWPESQPRGLVVVAWPGRKRLTVEPAGKLIKVEI